MMPKNELSKLARVQVDIPNVLDDLWTLDVKKSSANPPEEVKVNLEKMIERLAEHSKQTWVFRGKKETRDNVTHVWERLQSRSGGLFYAVNRGHYSAPQCQDTKSQMIRITPFIRLHGSFVAGQKHRE
jgi:hypothetical protein